MPPDVLGVDPLPELLCSRDVLVSALLEDFWEAMEACCAYRLGY